jgi:hypothetical protein
MTASSDNPGTAIRPWLRGMLALGILLLGQAQAQPAAEPSWAYRIQPGDTLIALTATYLDGKRSWRDLQSLNRVADPLKLPPGGILRMPVAWLQREASVARVLHTQGEASLLRAAEPARPLTVGAELRAGDRLRTGDQSSISLRFVDGSRLLIAPGSQLTIEQLLVYGRSAIPAMQLRLDQGGADSRVQPDSRQPPRYEMRTPSLNLGVRGTEFRVQLGEAGQTRVQVLEGAVAADTLQLNAGQGAVAVPGQPLNVRPLLAAPELARLPARLGQLPLSLAWRALDGASRYRAQVFAENDFDRLLLDGVFPGPQASWPDLPDGRYSLRVRGIDALGLEGRAADALFTLKARPEPPFSRAPAPDALVYGERVTLAWTRALAAQRYHLQLAATPDFAAPLRDSSDLTATEQDLTLPPGRYHWRLASIAAGEDEGPFGPVQSFTLRPPPPSPAVAPPEVGDEALQFRWQAGEPGQRYQLQWARDAEFTQGLQEISVDAAQATLPRPGPGTYYLRVRTITADGFAGPYGGAQQIELPHSRWLWLLPLGLLLIGL